MKQQTSAKVKILTVIIMIVGSFYWLFGKVEVWLHTIRYKRSQRKQIKRLLAENSQQNQTEQSI